VPLCRMMAMNTLVPCISVERAAALEREVLTIRASVAADVAAAKAAAAAKKLQSAADLATSHVAEAADKVQSADTCTWCRSQPMARVHAMGAGDDSGSSSCDMWQLQPPYGWACPTMSLDRTLCCHSLRFALRRRPRQQGRRLAPHWRRVSAGFWRLHPMRTRRRDRLTAGHFAGGVSDRCDDHFATCWCHAVARVYQPQLVSVTTCGRAEAAVTLTHCPCNVSAIKHQIRKGSVLPYGSTGDSLCTQSSALQDRHIVWHHLCIPLGRKRQQMGAVHVTRPRCRQHRELIC
jgi:hypothetical protein